MVNEIFLMVRRHQTTIFLDSSEEVLVSEIKNILSGITKRPTSEMQLIFEGRPLDENASLFENGISSTHARAQTPTTLGLCFTDNTGQFEPLFIADLSTPPELPDALKPSEGQPMEQN